MGPSTINTSVTPAAAAVDNAVSNPRQSYRPRVASICNQEVPVSHNRKDSTGTRSEGQSPSCAPATCIPNIPGSTGENVTSRTDSTGSGSVTEGDGDDDGSDTEGDGDDVPSSTTASSVEQAANSTPAASTSPTYAREIRIIRPWKHTGWNDLGTRAVKDDAIPNPAL